MTHSGRLELTWTNKDKRLHTTAEGGYEWVDPADPRVTEVRLIDEVDRVGEIDVERPNLLIHGDALHALTALHRIPELAEAYAGKVRLVYIDPPFNTGQAFANYDDNLEHSVWLSMLRDRLEQIRPLLAPDGSVWVHLDDAEVHRCRCVMDEVLGASNYVATIVWRRRNDPRNTARFVSGDHDSILVYAMDLGRLRTNELPRTEGMDSAYTNPDDDPRGPWRRGDLAARNYYSKGLYVVTTPSGRVIEGPPSGSYWRVSQEELARLDREGRIYWGADGGSRPYVKRYLSEVRGGRVVASVWPPEEVGFVRNGKEEVRALLGDVFATPKPERLLQRIVHIATDPGDLVLDCFVGSGTTAAVAHKMGRRWVAVEREADTIEQYARPRLTKVVDGEDPGGISEDVEWKGGGGFVVAEVGPSMFDLDLETGDVYMADAGNGRFALACAAHLGFPEERSGPFVGRKGRTLLAALDGVVGPPEVEHLAGLLDEGERMVIVAKVFAEGATARLRELSPGSKLRHAPNDLVGGRLP